jgi:DNA primase
MALFTNDSIERVREAVDMVDLVGSKTDLRRVGSRWVGLCPFHDERTPSFSIDTERKLYHCFGCGEGGDAIGFVRAVEGLDFPEAVETLAERYNVSVEREEDDPAREQRRRWRDRLRALLDRATRFYEAYLWESGDARKAREYLLVERGFSERVLREFRVGFAPSAWDRVTTGAQRDGFLPKELMAAGLAQRGRGGGLYDRFRGRIMFPLADARGRVLGFGARALGEGRGPKYLNSAESDLYQKRRQLFGIDLARAHSGKGGRIVVVEGYTDVLALHQAGIRETVGIMGTALTQEQLAELARAAPVIVLALDADRSGQEAMLRAARAARDRDVELRIVEMPRGSDPAELVAAEGAEGVAERLRGGIAIIQFQVRRVLADADLDTPAGRDRALEEARALIAATPERPVMREALVREVADRLDVPAEWVMAPRRPGASPAGGGVATARSKTPAGGASVPQPAAASPGVAALAAERAFLAMCLASGDLGRSRLELLSDDHLSATAARRARQHLAARFDDPLEGLPDDDPALAALVTDVAMAAEEQAAATEPVLRMSFLQLELRRIERELRRAAQEADHARQDELAGARQQVRREMDAVMGQTV